MKWKSTITPDDVKRLAEKHKRSEQDVMEAIRMIVEGDDWDGANEKLGTYGIEEIRNLDDSMFDLRYLNSGDTYDIMICGEIAEFSSTDDDEPIGELFAGSWGDWLEEQENEYATENNLIKCGYCSEWTDNDQKDWHDVVCQSCNHKVDGSA